MSKLSDYLEKHKIDPRRVLVASKKLEALKPEDRAIRLARTRARKGDEKAKEAAAHKPRSGKPVSATTLDRALAGGNLSGPARGRITRAVNAVLAQKSKGEVGAGELF
ncbi:MAG: hypothetical protein OXT09_12425 [Myxococcales bacterium]|nr:hypothetical protein [Myxococcales bacterium]